MGAILDAGGSSFNKGISPLPRIPSFYDPLSAFMNISKDPSLCQLLPLLS